MKLRTTTISILTIGLVAGSTVGVGAQEEAADPVGPAVLAWEYVDETDTGPVIEASDPRASGELALSDGGGLLYSEAGRGFNFGATSSDVTLTNDDGIWTGTYTQILGERFVPRRWTGPSRRSS